MALGYSDGELEQKALRIVLLLIVTDPVVGKGRHGCKCLLCGAYGWEVMKYIDHLPTCPYRLAHELARELDA